jgi:hypothetical protein
MGVRLSRGGQQRPPATPEVVIWPSVLRADRAVSLWVLKVPWTPGRAGPKLDSIVPQDSIDYAARALHLNRGDERAAVELLVGWCHSQSEVLEAFIPHDQLTKRVKRVVRKVKLAQKPEARRVSPSS